jgi:membrane-associated phospholipid phosphatase
LQEEKQHRLGAVVFPQSIEETSLDLLLLIAQFIGEIVRAVPGLLPSFALAWALVFIVLVLGFGAMKHRVRDRITVIDTGLRHWAKGMRYLDREDHSTERMALSWFFRFWTNFASAPSLSFFSLAIPFFMLYRDTWDDATYSPRPIQHVAAWLLPGFCFAGAMLLSFVMKRVFKRVRPPRDQKAFGHRLKDASFPSGHSLTAFCFWTMFTLVLVQSSVIPATMIIFLACGAVTIVALTGLSRIYLGVHFPSDVLGGYFIGAVWCVAYYVALQPVLLDVLRRPI